MAREVKGFSISVKQPDGSWTVSEPLDIEDYYNDTTTAMMTISSDEMTMILAVQRKDGKVSTIFIFRIISEG